MENDALQTKFLHDMMNTDEMRKKLYTIMKNEILSKYNFPTKASSDGYYHIYISDNTRKGGRRQVKSKTLEELQEKVCNYELAKAGGEKKTFKDVFDLVIVEKTKYINDPEKLISIKNSIIRRHTEFKRFFGGTKFAKMPVDEITTQDIEEIFLSNIEKFTLRIKPIEAMKTILNQVFDYAFKHDIVCENVLLRADLKKFKELAAKDVPIEQRAFPDDDLKRFLDFLHNWQIGQPCYIPAYALELQILIGLRRGEVPPLMWSDVTADYLFIHRQQITVDKSGDTPRHSMIVEHTKTNKDRRFPMCDDLKDFLQRLKAVHDEYYPDSIYLFPANTPNGVISNDVVRHFYLKMLEKLGIEPLHGITRGTHSFRRNAITRTVNASGGNLVLAAGMFGNSPQIIQKHYFTGIELDAALAVANKSGLL